MELKPTIFEFTSYKVNPDQKQILFNYTVKFNNADDINYTETIILPKAPNFKHISQDLFDSILKNLHLALGVSYYKIHCSPKIKVNYILSEDAANFWNVFYKKGLGEFLFRNNLNPALVPNFTFKKDKKEKCVRVERNFKFLVGIGGGKDSIVSAELLKNYGANISLINIETHKDSDLINNVLTKIATPDESFRLQNPLEILRVRRNLDEKLFDTNVEGYKGHIPVSGIYAFLGLLSCVMYGFSYFVVSNEFSSNFGNTRFKGKAINHQWSKSFEFENLFQKYVSSSITPDIIYFSLLRSFYEIRIAELFVNYKKFFPIFSSCNNNFKINSQNISENKLWCGKCAKCIFTFLIFSPFLTKEKLINIFGENYMQNVGNLVTLRDILGFGIIKPFDCVGTFDEAKVAFYMAREKFRDDVAGEMFLPKIDPEDNRYFFYSKNTTLKIYFEGKIKPLELVRKVFKTQLSSVPDYLKFLGMQNAIVLGYGKEGQVTEEYLKINFPELKIGVGDVSADPDYLLKQDEYDIAIRSPGVRKELIKIPYTTATNIFFSWIKQIPGVKIIGVTGSKGKSTTASLIYHILSGAGKRVELLGNIGEPMLGTLLKNDVKEKTIFILELSSYQLDDISYSPDVAVITNIFPEHVDYHYNIKNYYTAKKNIIKFQNEDDIFIFNHKNKKIAAWLKGSKVKPMAFAKSIPVDASQILLQGKHNMDNIKAAISVARVFDVNESIIKEAIKTFKGLPHRLEFVAEFLGIKFYDDAISTTPESTIEAIKTLPKIGTIFLGGQDRGYNFKKLEQIIKKKKIKNIVLFPETGKRMFKKGRRGLNILETTSMDEAVEFAYKYTEKSKICLLSCASPSYSLWKNFEEKGEKFQNAVYQFSKIENKKNNPSEETL